MNKKLNKVIKRKTCLQELEALQKRMYKDACYYRASVILEAINEIKRLQQDLKTP